MLRRPCETRQNAERVVHALQIRGSFGLRGLGLGGGGGGGGGRGRLRVLREDRGYRVDGEHVARALERGCVFATLLGE